MQAIDVIGAIEKVAPRPLQEDYDNTGIQVGDRSSTLTGVLVCLDITEEVIDEAIQKGCNMVVSHHPLLFRGLKRICGDSLVEKCVIKAIKNDIVLYSSHTNLDNAFGGVNHKIASILGLEGLEWIVPGSTVEGVESGSGLIGSLPSPKPAGEFLSEVKKAFEVDCISYCGPLDKTVTKVALCGGSGSFLIDDAIAKGADCFLTGEISYHHYFGYEDTVIAALGHYQSEQYTKDVLKDIIQNACPGIKVEVTSINTNPICYL
ncbi:MAG: Nif3-like dinuclear metal center hexameric protein [Bacteroidales bacterium]|nr:Nif3-like dinuclear metal center hexameric protein [Bacteroidales bacterium]